MEVQSKDTISSEIILKELQSPFTSDIGKGFSGSIKNVRLTLKEEDGINTTRSRAVKILPLKEKKRVLEEAKREIKVFETLPSHPNILHFYGSCTHNDTAYLVLEKADTDALSILKRQTPTRKESEEQPSELWLSICLDIAKGMEHLHSHGFYHRDLHMQNWLFFLNDTSKQPITKLSDFGGTLYKDDAPISFCGHRKFCSPQVLKQREQKLPIQYTFADDVYMFGMSLYEVVVGYNEGRIWPSLTEVQVMKKIISGERPPMQSLNINSAFKKLIEECWNEDPNKRPTFSQIVKTLESIQKSKEKSLKIRENHKKTSAKGVDHTIHLYMFDEVMSVLQKSIRRGQIEDAMYWTAELDLSGKGKIALQRISVICSEDVSLGVVSLPTYLRDQYKKYSAVRRSDEKTARKILLESASAIASVIKCQVANHACGASLNYVQKSVENKDPFYSQYLPKASEHWVEDLRKLMDLARQSEFDLNNEKKILFLLQRLYMEGFEESIWKMIVKLQVSNPITKSAIDALYDLTIPKHIGGRSGSRLRLFHAVLLYIRERYLDFSQNVPEIKVDDSIIAKYYTTMGLEGRNKDGIPDYGVDRHNKRGKGAGSDDLFHYGEDTRDALAIAAEHWKVDISSWTEEEKQKSHGAGRRMFKDITIGTPSLLTQFFDEGDLLDRETFVMPGKHTHDPFFFDARDFYTQWEIQYGSTEAKSEKMMQEQLKLLEKFAVKVQANDQQAQSSGKAEL